MLTTKKSFLAVWVIGAVVVTGGALGCSSSSNMSSTGSGGTAGGAAGGHGGQGGIGGQAGAAGAAGGGGSKTDGGSDRMDAVPGFIAYMPCESASAYVSNTTQIAFGGTLGLNYSPACLKVARGATVTFTGDFATHPLTPSVSRTNPGPNPIVSTDTGTTASFTFNTSGMFGYFCLQHGNDEGVAMAGMIWVE